MEKSEKTLLMKYPSSEPCNCETCKSFCIRPGWWTVEEATKAIDAGYANRMMLEIAPELTFGVLSPAFYGSEKNIALKEYSIFGCCFFTNGLCELHNTGLKPLECRFSHHSRPRKGSICHSDLEQNWKTSEGQALVERWIQLIGLLKKYGL